jgi:hypothetical protein
MSFYNYLLSPIAYESVNIKFSESGIFLIERQRQAIMFNRCLLLTQAKQPDKAREAISSFLRQFPSSHYPVFAQACLAYSEGNISVCNQILTDASARLNPNDSLRCQLTLAQISLLKNDIPLAISALKSTSVCYRPACVAILVSLHERINDIDGACRVFSDAIAFWVCYVLSQRSIKRYVSAFEQNASIIFI